MNVARNLFSAAMFLIALTLGGRAAVQAAVPRQGPSVDFRHGDLKVSNNSRYLVHADGTPFFYLGDTAWELFHRLNREEAEKYLENRRNKGFTVIQAVALAERDGLDTANSYGHRPLLQTGGKWDPLKPDIKQGPENDYWDHVDWIIDKAAEKGIFIGLLPTWGDKVYRNSQFSIGPVIFDVNNAREYGKWIGERYKNRPNIIWINGGDRPPEEKGQDFRAIWRALAEGVKSADTRHLMTYHSHGGTSSSRWFHDDKWLDFNLLQSGHGMKEFANYRFVISDYNRQPPKPVIDGEPCYELIPRDFTCINGRYSDYEVRRAAYWALFSGAHGHTYGCNPIWQMHNKGEEGVINPRWAWDEVLDMPGAQDMQRVRALMESRPMLDRIPDQNMIAEGPKTPLDYAAACRGTDYAFIYVPTFKNVKVQLGLISGEKIRVWRYGPQTGETEPMGEFANTGTRSIDVPWGQDWVIVLDDASKNYAPPGVAMPQTR